MSDEDYLNLLSDVKDYLKISWNDDKTDKNLTGMIKRGVKYLQNIAGVDSINFTEEDLPKQLLLDYCRYANSHALEVFAYNYQGDLLELHFMFQAPLQGAVTDEN